jgi:uncharacterized Ntn-hydrolase superfamily protein
MRRGILAVVLVGSLVPGAARATYSIVATDQGTSHVGGAGTSCVGSLGVVVILGTAPGIGAVHAQAQLNAAGRDRAVELLEQGEAPEDIITAITAPAFDPSASSRQYGVVDLLGRAAGFTGSTNGDYADDRQGQDGVFTYSVQGNILTSGLVIDQAESGFVGGGGCDLPDRLMLALEAGAENGEGDSRCTPDGIPSDSAFLRVVDQNGADIVFIEAIDTAPESPLIELRTKYDAWREESPCADDGTGTDTDTGSTGGGGTDDSGSGSSSSGGTGTDDSGSGSSSSGGTGTDDGGGGSTSSGGDDGSDTDGESSAGSDEDDKGCGCRTHGGTGAVALLPALFVLCRRRRRQAPRSG